MSRLRRVLERIDLASTLRALVVRLPGILLCAALSAASVAVQSLEARVFGHPFVEALVVAILLGAAVRTAWEPGPAFRVGIAFTAKQLLEVAVAGLGLSVSLREVLASGGALLAGIAGTVVLALGSSYAIGRALGLDRRMAVLIAGGNAICGNSAIAAIAPVIGARPEDVAASIAFTAALGVLLVIGLPLFIPFAGLSEHQYGVLAGLTVYAVPQVLAATAPVGALGTQVGTLVKLVRVLMLGPVVFALSLAGPALGLSAGGGGGRLPRASRLLPWFIVAFLVLAGLRTLDVVPVAILRAAGALTPALTVASMAALGLGVDVRALARVGGRVTATVTASILVLIAIALLLIAGLHIG